MAEILVVDDERIIREGLRALLAGEGHDVRVAKNGEDALRQFAEHRPDLVLLDVMMPKLNGFRACEEIRKLDRTVPVIFLTAMGSEADQVRGMGLGADDYIPKDAGNPVLLARIHRALARVEEFDLTSPVVAVGQVRIDLDKCIVIDGAKKTPLTATEAGIVRLLASDRGRYFTKDEIIAALRGEGYSCEDGLVYTHVYNLRKKLGASAGHLASDRASGYRLQD